MDAEILASACEQVLPLGSAKLSEGYYYDSLPLCVIDAVFSMGVRYTSVQNVVSSYCRCFGLREYNQDRGGGAGGHTISDLIKNIEDIGADPSADALFHNRQRTSTRSGILKSEAVLRFAKVLSRYGVDSFSDLDSAELPPEAEEEIKKIPGQGSGLCLQYFYMLAGNDNLAKPDRHVLRFIERYTGKKPTVPEAQKLLEKTVDILKPQYPDLTVRLLDYTIWNYMAHEKQSKNVKVYNKLVRDRIPEIIEASGKSCTWETLSDERYIELLNKKLQEEVAEYLENGTVEELADIGEVMHAILDYKGIPLTEFQRVRNEKLQDRGGFKKRILLKEVREEK